LIDANPYAFEIIGRAIIAWSNFDQAVITQTWMSRDPLQQSAFRIGGVDIQFSNRWGQWCRIHKPYASDKVEFQRLVEEVVKLSTIRNDLAHNVCEIMARSNAPEPFVVGILRRHPDWNTAFEKWATKYAHVHWRSRPPGPRDEELHYTCSDILTFITRTHTAHSAISEHAAALIRATSHP
jgi:hypothetical protein